MKKLQKLLSIVMVIFALAMTGCSNDNTTPASTEPSTTQENTVENDQVEEVAEVTETEEVEEATETEEVEDVAEAEEVEETTEVEDATETVESDLVEVEVGTTDEIDVNELEIDAETAATESVEYEEVDFEQLSAPEAGETVATIKVTGYGEIKIKFFPDKAPLAVENFVTHARDGYYDGIIFHRVIDGFMIQGGDPTGTGAGGESIWGTPFVNEDHEDLYHFNGALSMANAGKDTNGSQFFIVNSPICFPKSSSRSYYSDYATEIYTTIGGTSSLDGGYTVFGQVYEGLELVQAIMQVKTTGAQGSTPVDDIVIESVVISQY